MSWARVTERPRDIRWSRGAASSPMRPEAVPEQELGRLAARLYEPQTGPAVRKRLLVYLAHHGSARAASELQRFVEHASPDLRKLAERALEEALLASAPASWCLRSSDPCPCGSGDTFKGCCAPRLR